MTESGTHIAKSIAEVAIPYAMDNPYEAAGMLAGILAALIGMVPLGDRLEFFERIVEGARSEIEKSASSEIA